MRSIVLVVFAMALIAAAQPAPAPVRVISYNVQFLPGIAESHNKRPEPEYRAKRIAEEVSKFDIVALQETFEEHHRAAIKEELKKAWNGVLNVVESPKPKEFLTNGGCLIMTRLPIIDGGAVVYKNFSKPEQHGFRADGFAAKGTIWARIARDDASKENFIDVFATHLEARADDLRPLQYQEMADFIKEKSDPKRPILVVGDLNTRGSKEDRADSASQYSALMRALDAARPDSGIVDTWLELQGEALGGTTEQESADVGKRIDYILYSNPQPPAVGLKPLAIEVNTYQDPKVTALSDHNAVIAEFDWPATTQP